MTGADNSGCLTAKSLLFVCGKYQNKVKPLKRQKRLGLSTDPNNFASISFPAPKGIFADLPFLFYIYKGNSKISYTLHLNLTWHSVVTLAYICCLSAKKNQQAGYLMSCGVIQQQLLSRLMRLWHFLSSVNSFFKYACAAIQWG